MEKTTEEKIFRLAELKRDAKQLDILIKELQSELISEGVACDTITPVGKLAFQTRETVKVTDKLGLIKFMGQKAYNAHSSISKTGVTKAIGALGYQETLDKRFMEISNISEFFVLRK